MNNEEKLINLTAPDSLKQKLIIASAFIAVFEHFKYTISENVKYFNFFGYKNNTTFNRELQENYEKTILSKINEKEKNKAIKATLLWYEEHGAISEKEVKSFKIMTEMRNTLSHELLSKIFQGLPENIYDIYFDMTTLFEKITKWWVMEIEIPTDPNILPEQYKNIKWDEISSLDLCLIKTMTDIVFMDNEKYLKILNEKHGKAGGENNIQF